MFRPPRGRALPRAGLLELVTRYLRPGIGQWKRQDLLRSWGTPIVLLPCSPTPAGPTHQAIAMRRRGPRCVHDEGSRIRTFEAQSHGFGTGCLRFAGRVAPTPRKTRFRLLARLFRTGLITRRVPSKGFKMYPTSILLSQVQRRQGHNTGFMGYPFTPTPPEVVLRSQASCDTTGAWRDGSAPRKLPS